MKLMVHVSPTMVPDLKLPTLLQSVSTSLQGSAQCRSVTVVLRPECPGALGPVTREVTGIGALEEKRVIPITNGLPGRAFQVRKSAVLSVREAGQILSETGPFCGETEETFCCVPLLLHDKPIGILALGPLDQGSFRGEEIDFLSRIAREVAGDLENTLVSNRKELSLTENAAALDEPESELQVNGIVGRSAQLRRVLGHVETVAGTDATVLLCGETGTGKELIARAIHDLSSRRCHPFVKLNCAAIPAGLLESELFGHEKGAFTGALTQRIGRFELADQGTIFLDEVGELPLELQPKLLRVLQEREFERLGNSHTLRSDGRLIASTNRNLATMVGEHEFRADLFYRLNVFPIQLPPLRERPTDIPLLVWHFVQRFARRMNRRIDIIPPETMRALANYEWPGNIRELQNVIERAVIRSPGPMLKVPSRELSHPVQHAPGGTTPLTLEEVERAHILAALKDTRWVLSGPGGAAARLGVKRTTLQYRMDKLGIIRPGKYMKSLAEVSR